MWGGGCSVVVPDMTTAAPTTPVFVLEAHEITMQYDARTASNTDMRGGFSIGMRQAFMIY